MEQIEFFDIPSPCVGVCEADNRGYCKGCLRSRDERLQWLNFTDAKKVDVIRLCKQRKRRRQLALMKAYKQQVLTARSEANAQFEFDPPQD
ncbi:DUF1289 domain-containing protein [Shewanella gelidii]|uniref:DUF1289 domain-containing protein n=1 Tax=Shewanella gelidii TaxID=1642821 RepID=A0A917JL63_9GAMM|nr:DUF1289 domain-containing protein [Shewanella gelidii]MCL1096812.1 DUF1289 domain-containing protein [Shewanella gelidii]GGI70348.1 DUF1289 domain-containing protein [Shewanella gelidii]